MPNPIVLGTPATCGDLATGASNVFINNKPVMLVGQATAGGPILGPGSLPYSVLVGGTAISLVGDSITGHGDGAHSNPTFASPLPDVVSVRIGP
jgi:uncharacterized Zn-binding protein involved in type VI secretion